MQAHVDCEHAAGALGFHFKMDKFIHEAPQLPWLFHVSRVRRQPSIFHSLHCFAWCLHVG